MTAALGRLEPVPVRDVWPHEANDFTPWLAQPENSALLAKMLNLGELSEVRTEVQVGIFYIDISLRTSRTTRSSSRTSSDRLTTPISAKS